MAVVHGEERHSRIAVKARDGLVCILHTVSAGRVLARARRKRDGAARGGWGKGEGYHLYSRLLWSCALRVAQDHKQCRLETTLRTPRCSNQKRGTKKKTKPSTSIVILIPALPFVVLFERSFHDQHTEFDNKEAKVITTTVRHFFHIFSNPSACGEHSESPGENLEHSSFRARSATCDCQLSGMNRIPTQ